MTESQFQAQVVTLAESLGWEWMHVGRTGKYNANGAKGTLGTGWPDLTLVRGNRILFVELKAEKKKTTPAQDRVMLILDQLWAGDAVHIWRPSDWNLILEVLA